MTGRKSGQKYVTILYHLCRDDLKWLLQTRKDTQNNYQNYVISILILFTHVCHTNFYFPVMLLIWAIELISLIERIDRLILLIQSKDLFLKLNLEYMQ